ncbi:SNF2-related protein [Actinomadura madurae]|uniref:SNF2-related protein n=1 Tax=Actinomadura madurae TaxID=1993 RepID=UPI0020274124|nr:SNF2-related protein [Actinomadura madurae]URN00263.1 SNF2-related protein [Actinomadura madurae]URN02420.1 SNF2-related protein [Actinomadura madurae]
MTKHAKRVLRDIEVLRRAARELTSEYRLVCADVEAVASGRRAVAAQEWLGSVPVARLKQVADGPIRFGAVRGAEFVTVADVLGSTPDALVLLRGIGPDTARRLHAAAAELFTTATWSASLRITVGPRDERTESLVVALHRLLNGNPELRRAVEFADWVETSCIRYVYDARRGVGWRRVLLPPAARYLAREATAELSGLLESSGAALLRSPGLIGARVPVDEAWRDFQRNADAYHAELAEVAGLVPAGEAAEGFLPEGLAADVWDEPLDDTHLKVSLREYQSFGARFALLRRRVILGDEAGLGKTVQAIAAIAHRRGEGATHFLVACPGSVLLNWVRDIETFSSIEAHLIQGPDRDAALERWTGRGGIAVAPLDWLPYMEDRPALGMFVVDEAHQTKNSWTLRARAVARQCEETEHVMLLTGMPMEDRVEEFRSLVGHLPPEAAEGIRPQEAALGSRAFRVAVAPVYLRRDRRDVRAELPDVVRVDELVAPGRGSAKLRRLKELVREAEANELKVVVHSCSPDVLAAVRKVLATGGRQVTAEAFAAEDGHAVLVAGPEADGPSPRGASVVIFCEPQEDPDAEARAVGRVLGAGPAGMLRVHRLVAPGTVDEWIGEGPG